MQPRGASRRSERFCALRCGERVAARARRVRVSDSRISTDGNPGRDGDRAVGRLRQARGSSCTRPAGNARRYAARAARPPCRALRTGRAPRNARPVRLRARPGARRRQAWPRPREVQRRLSRPGRRYPDQWGSATRGWPAVRAAWPHRQRTGDGRAAVRARARAVGAGGARGRRPNRTRGTWDVTLTYAPDSAQTPAGAVAPGAAAPPTAAADAPSLFTALQERLGLRLVSTRTPVEVLVVDRVQPPTPD